MAVALYARVSTTRQAENDLSIPDQLNQMREWCKANGYAIAEEYIEPGASAKDDKRPVFGQMIREATLCPSPFQAIIVHSQSRFYRDAIEFGLHERKLNEAQVRLISITQPTTDDPNGELIRRIFSFCDEYQSKETSKHTARSMIENAKQGYFNGSKPPFGYQAIETETIGNRGRRKKKLIIDETEAETARRVYELYVNGYHGKPMGMKSIVNLLNDQGITMRGRPWRVQKLQEVLSDTLYIGQYFYNKWDSKKKQLRPKEERIQINVPPIIDQETFAKAERMRYEHAPGRVAPRLVNSKILLSGLLKCGECGSGMTLMTGKGGRYRYYKCVNQKTKGKNRCSTPNIPMEKFDRLVLERLANRILVPDRVRKMLVQLQNQLKVSRGQDDETLMRLKRQLLGNREKIDNLYNAIAKGMPFDENTKQYLHQFNAERENILIELSRLKRKQHMPFGKINKNRIEQFCKAVKTRLMDSESGFGKGYLKLLVDDIRVEGQQAIMRGSHEKLAYAIGVKQSPSKSVPFFMREWRALAKELRTVFLKH